MVTTLTVELDFVDLRNADQEFVTGRHVDNLQGALKGTRNVAWDPGPIDGLGGPRTRAAVLALQADNSLEVDAIVGPITWGHLIPFPLLPDVALPPDGFSRTPPVDATDEFAGLSPQPSFERLVQEVAADIERRYPTDESAEGGPATSQIAMGTAGTQGIALVRRPILGDDAIAGVDYTVTGEFRRDGYIVMSATKSTICRRGVSDGLCV